MTPFSLSVVVRGRRRQSRVGRSAVLPQAVIMPRGRGWERVCRRSTARFEGDARCRLLEQVRPMDVVVPDGSVTRTSGMRRDFALHVVRVSERCRAGVQQSLFPRRCGTRRPLQCSAARWWSSGCAAVGRVRWSFGAGNADSTHANGGTTGQRTESETVVGNEGWWCGGVNVRYERAWWVW